MHRFWLDSDCIQNGNILLKGSCFHHIIKVCRFRKGQRFILVSGNGYQYQVELQSVESSTALARVLQKTALPPVATPFIHLAISCPKFSVLESILKKSVELGVSCIHPFVSEWSFVRKTSAVSDKRIQRFQSIIQQSTAQSLCSKPSQLFPIVSLDQVLNQYSKASKAGALLFYEGANCLSFKQAVESLNPSSLSQVWLFIGSEGGFSPQEVSIFQNYQISTVTLGNQILKVETACLTAIGVLKYTLGQL